MPGRLTIVCWIAVFLLENTTSYVLAQAPPPPDYTVLPGSPPQYPATGYPTTTGRSPEVARAYPTASPPAASSPQTPQSSEEALQPIEGGQIIAWVGGEPVLAAEVLPAINDMLARNQQSLAGASSEEVAQLRTMLMRREIGQLIDNKLLWVEAKRKIPAEAFENIESRIGDEFESAQLPKLFESTETSTRAQLEQALRKVGSSLSSQQAIFAERLLASQWLRQQIDLDVEVTHDEMLAYYQEHLDEYSFEAKARWEELAVMFTEFPSQEAAYREMAEMGNAVWRGTPLTEVAKTRSQGLTAEEGGQHDWTTRGALVSEELNRALFTLPVGQLSPIIETKTGFHIIRVTERRDAGRTPFVEAQVDIKEKIRKGQTQAQITKYLAELRKQTPVWTIFDDQPPATP